jgi:multicomponent Na+:H+ antiporter subunit B
LGYFVWGTFSGISYGEPYRGVSEHYVKQGIEENRGSNLVTSIVVNYRGFDTLGEVTVLFLATTGLGSILFRKRKHGEEEERVLKESSQLVRIGSRLLFPFIALLGIYVFIHGHLTPGGGFQGGAIIATGFLLMLVAYKNYRLGHGTLTWVESFAGITFAGIGMWGLITGGTFLENNAFSGLGNVNDLISGGVIPIIYIAVGLKVAAELTGVLDILLNIKPNKN